jgi:hypothetical protein
LAEQSDERRVTAELGEELISVMLPDMDPEVVQLTLSGRAARSPALLQEYMELLARIRDVGIDRAQFRAILRLNPETPLTGDDNPLPPIQ